MRSVGSIVCGVVITAVFAMMMGVVSVSAAGYQKSLVIDWGSEWTKVVIMNPHAKSALSRLEMAINEQSNRKTPSVVGVTGEGDESERVLGEDAAGLLYRAPSDAYGYLKRLLGQFRDSAAAKSYETDLSGPAKTLTLSEAAGRRTVQFVRGGATVSVEELVVSLLQWCKRSAEAHILSQNGETTTITDAVLIMPEHWTEKQRTLYTQLATIAGLNVKGSVNELTAVALDYGNRNLESLTAGATKKVLFYGVGAESTAVTAIEFTKTSDSAFKIKVIGSAFDAEIGGLDFDLAVREHLIAEFDTKNKKKNLPSIRTNKKAAAKLLREARDLKEQLSAGQIGTIQVEEIYEGVDFATTLTREKFDELTRPLLARAIAPIKQLYTAHGAALADAGLMELYGGGTRIPALQTLISSEWKSLGALGKHVDGDEAGAFGAGLYAANLNSVPGTKKVEIEDVPSTTSVNSADELSAADITALRDRLARFDSLAQRRAANQESRNKLETTIVELKERVEAVGKHLSESDRDAVNALVTGARDWLDYETGKSTAASDYDAKLEALKSGTAPLLKSANDKYAKDQEKKKKAEAADEKARAKAAAGKARERAQDKAYARAQAAKEQQKTKAKAASGSGKGKKAGKKSDKSEL